MITVYVLRASVGGKRYVGITDNLVRRLEEHRRAHSTVGKLLGEFTVLLTEPYATYAEARKREKYLKSGRGREWLDRQFLRQRGGENTCLGDRAGAL